MGGNKLIYMRGNGVHFCVLVLYVCIVGLLYLSHKPHTISHTPALEMIMESHGFSMTRTWGTYTSTTAAIRHLSILG